MSTGSFFLASLFGAAMLSLAGCVDGGGYYEDSGYGGGYYQQDYGLYGGSFGGGYYDRGNHRGYDHRGRNGWGDARRGRGHRIIYGNPGGRGNHGFDGGHHGHDGHMGHGRSQ